MDSLPNELLLLIMDQLPFHILKNRTRFVCGAFRIASNKLIEQRLSQVKNSLDKLYPNRQSPTRILSNTFELDNAFLLGEFQTGGEHPSTNLVSGIALNPSRISVSNCSIVFTPFGNEIFGIWVNKLGFVPLTTSNPSSSLHISKRTTAYLHYWLHPAGSTIPTTSSSSTTLSSLPTATKPLNLEDGTHCVTLRDEIGFAGVLTYRTTNLTEPITSNDELLHELQDLLITNGSLEENDAKVRIDVLEVHMDPQVLLQVPV